MDGQMSEDIRIGVMVRTEMQGAGTGWRKKMEGDARGPVMSFSSALLQAAGGIRKLFSEWEEVPW